MKNIFKSIFKSKGSISINGQSFNVSGRNNISIQNNRVFIDGKEIKNLEDIEEKEIIIEINGDLESVDAGNNVVINGNIQGNVDIGNMCEIKSEVIAGSIDCGNMCTINSNEIIGDISTGNMCTVNRR